MIELNARVTGNGPPLILLHGLFGSLENLGAIARLLAPDYEIHSLDMRNHGRSPHTEQMNYELMAGDVNHYLQSNKLAGVRVLGHSMGGKIGMKLALRYPESVVSLVVADIAPVTYNSHHDAIFEGLASIPLQSLQSRQEAESLLKPFVQEAPVRQFLLKNLVKKNPQQFQWRMNLTSITRHYTAILEGQHSDIPYTGPVLFLKGALSDYIQAAYQAHTGRLFPNAQLKIIPGTGHWLHAEKPDLFSRLVLRFLQSGENP